MIPDVVAVLSAAGLSVSDGPPKTPVGPHVVVYGGTPQPTTLTLGHRHVQTSYYVQVVCVSNTAEGARRVADRAIRAIDGRLYSDRSRYRVTYASPPIQDRTDSSEWRWTTTVEIDLTTGR